MRAIEPIAIIGIGCRLPGGVRSAEDLWSLLSGGGDAITEVPKERWDLASFYHPDRSTPGRMNTRWGGFLDHIDRFDAQFFGISPREAAPADPQQRLMLEVAYEAAEDAGLTMASLSGKRAGVYVGISGFEYSSLQINDRPTIDAYTNLGSALCIAANRISYFFNLLGPSLAVDTACSSSLVAVDWACRSLSSNDIELAFVGGVNIILRPEASIGFSKASMLAPDGRCKSFDAGANGYVRAEGAAAVVLKPLERALADRDCVYAVIRATSVNQDGRSVGITVPSRTAQESNIADALRLAGLAPGSVQYVEAHGTGTPVGDPIEAAALGAVYGKAQLPEERCVIGSIKSNLGHLEAAAGIAGLIKTALCLQHRQIPASLHFREPNPDIPFADLRLRVAQALEPWPPTAGQPPRAAVNSFGFGGTNAHAILEAHCALGRRADDQEEPVRRPYLLPLSARSASALPDVARSYLRALGDERALKPAALRDICHSASLRRSHHEHRLALVAQDKAELSEQLEGFLRGEACTSNAGVRISSEPPCTAFVCSGMGQQRAGMGCELLSREPVFRRAFEEVSELFAALSGWSLLATLGADEQTMAETRVAQPMLFALQIALAALWRSWGIEPAAVVGHSAGEMAAAAIAGALSLQDAVRVTFHRSRLQHRVAGHGGMLAVEISRREAERLVERHPRDISIAAINGPRSVTLSGDGAILAAIDASLNAAGLFSRPLQVEVPFHSPKMEPLAAELTASLNDVRPRKSSTPFFSTVTGTALAGTELDARYWYRNVREPVLFDSAIGALAETGCQVFLEIGAHSILRRDIDQSLKERSASGTTLCSLRRGDGEQAALLGSLGRLFCLGADVDWRALHPADARGVKLPSYPFVADRHWRESENTRQLRVGTSVHPLLGKKIDAPNPTWTTAFDAADTSYLEDHRVGGSAVFPAAGYVEMALAAAGEVHGALPCVLEELELLEPLRLDGNAAPCGQLALDTESSGFQVHVRSGDREGSWDLHARGFVRAAARPPAAALDVAQVRSRSRDRIGRDEYYRLFAARGIDYGPCFRGIAGLWQGEREALAEIHVPRELSRHLAEYRFHPAVLDACLQAGLATLPLDFLERANAETFVPARIERVRFHATPPAKLLSRARLREFRPTQLTFDVEITDHAGARLVDVEGLVCRPTGHRAQAPNDTVYEYQWRHAPRSAIGGARSSPLPSPAPLAPMLQDMGEKLWRRFDRSRFQGEFRCRSRTVAAAYAVRALRELGWQPELRPAIPIDTLAARLGVAPQYRQLLKLVLQELSPEEISRSGNPQPLWRTLWGDFPEYHVELTLFRRCGDKLAAVLRGDVDPLNLVFPEDGLATAEHLYEDSATLRLNNLIVQKAVGEITRQMPSGKGLHVLEIGGGTGGTTSFVVPLLPKHCTQYMFTDISLRFIARAQQKFAKWPFMQYRPLDIELDPVEQGLVPHSFDMIIASDVLHATKDLRKSLERVKRLLASGGILVLVEITRPWLSNVLVFGLLKGWWLFNDDVRKDQPAIPQDEWVSLLRQVGFSDTVAVADCPHADSSQHSVIIARALQGTPSLVAAPQPSAAPRAWLVFADDGPAGAASVGAELTTHLRNRGDRVIQVRHAAGYRELDDGTFNMEAGNADDVKRLIADVRRRAPHLAGVVHCWSLDTLRPEATTTASLKSSARLGCVGVLQLIQAMAATDGLAIDGLWLVTRSAQPLATRFEQLEPAQSPLWGFGRVAINEYPNLRCRLVDLARGSREEIALLAEELDAGGAEDEVALHGELRYVRRLVPASLDLVQGMRRSGSPDHTSFRIEMPRPGLLDSLSARPLVRRRPEPHEVEIEVTATGVNFKDLMLSMGMMPKDAIAEDPFGETLGFECSGRVAAIGDAVSEFSVGDEVVCAGPGSLGTHTTLDARFVAAKPSRLSLEQAATIPVAFITAFYSLHTLGQIRAGERVLIHAATGGVGLAAVQLAQQAGAVVFATAGSPEKRELLSAIGAPHVMDSRGLAFADEVMELTGGEGVDLVLNSLAGDAIDKSLSILRPYGRFVEIGKTDIYKNRRLGMRALRKNVSVFVVDLISKFDRRPDLARSLLREVLQRFEAGRLHPLPHRVFPVGRVSDAFRYMAQAKHVGKVVISVADRAELQLEKARSAVAIRADASYLITGGLGGLGLAFAERLARHGARHLALLGRTGPSRSAQAAVEKLRQRGVEVMVRAADIADQDQTRRAIADVQERMGPLRGVMHGAMVLDDAPIEHLTEERMWNAMAPKVLGAWNLHLATAGAPLDFFLLFSSFASMLGSPGQANYVAGNAFLDALAYYRRSLGLPAVVVNWGTVGDAGHVADNQDISNRLARMGLSPIPVSEMLDRLDEVMASHAVQVAVARIDWGQVGRANGARVPARFAALMDATSGEKERSPVSDVRAILEAEDAALPALLETYFRDHLARATGTSPARIDAQQPLQSLGLDSLIAVDVRNRVGADLGLNVPLTAFMQGANIRSLSRSVAAALRENNRGKRAEGGFAQSVHAAAARSAAPPDTGGTKRSGEAARA